MMPSQGQQSDLAAEMINIVGDVSFLTGGSLHENLNLKMSQVKMFNKSKSLKDINKFSEAKMSQIDDLAKRIDNVVKAINVLIKSKRRR